MDLHVTLASSPPHSSPTREIVVDPEVLGTGSALADQLEAAGYSGPFSVDGRPLNTLVPHSGALVDGAIIVAGPLGRAPGPPHVPHLVFVVCAGPDAGQVIPLTRGGYTIGRAGSDIVIADPSLSRRHALLTVTADSILLEDLGSANGTFVDDERIIGTGITVSAGLRFGASRCRIELMDDAGWVPGPAGDILEPLAVGQDVPRRPSRTMVLTALLPLVLGVVLALATGMWFFLAFSALSAGTGLVPLLAYRRQSRDFLRAVRTAAERDRDRRTRAVPEPGQTALDALRALHRRPGPPPRSRSPARDPLLLRLGTADQPARLASGPTGVPFIPPILPGLPLHLPCPVRTDATGSRRVTITGEDGAVQALARAVLLQVAHPGSGGAPIICWGSVPDLPQAARFLPNVRVTRDPVTLASLLREHGIRLVLQFSDDLPALPGLTGLPLVWFAARGAAAEAAPPDGHLTIGAGTARASIGGCEYDVVPDGVSAQSFERTARALARAAADGAGSAAVDRPGVRPVRGTIPRSVSFWDGQPTPDSIVRTARRRWPTADARRPVAHVGASATGPVLVDLVEDGPHLLVAGTTGSGKSEFLRTLVLGLAMDQPPRQLALLLIDYKGGAALGPLAALPHCVGSLTDLSVESTARALTSLRAELGRRERLCADHASSDLDELRAVSPSSCPPRLVVVIDEFRMLSDDVPSAGADLLKLAALGRSLGVHLVLATQRVQGAVPPDMRANLTSTVLLRVQTAMESQELLGSGVAADLPVGTPGRAFLRRGAEPPVAFQVSSCSGATAADLSSGWQDLVTYLGGGAREEPAERPVAGSGREPPSDRQPTRTGRAAPGPGQDRGVLERAAAALAEAAAGMAAGRPAPPVLPPLPTSVGPAACTALLPADPSREAASATGALLGIADLPDHQAQRLLQWRPADHSHLALVGLPGSGGTEALGGAVASLLDADPDLHLYLLDGDGSLSGSALLPQVGAHVPSHETRRAARVLERLAALRVEPPEDLPRIVLAITGWGRWSSQFRAGRSARAEEDLLTIARDGSRIGVAVLVTGDRDLTTSRFFALLPNRVYLPLGAHTETTLTWPTMPALDAVMGRGLAQGRITGSWGDAACQLALGPSPTGHASRPPARRPFPVHPLPRTVMLEALVRRTGGDAGGRHDLLLGVSGDDLHPYFVPLDPGEAYLVLGRASSGRTNALEVLSAASASSGSHRVPVAPPPGIGAAQFWRGIADPGSTACRPEHCILVVDDADTLPADVHQVLSEFVARGAAAVLSAAPGPTLMARVPLSLQARSTGRGFVLAPRSSGDGDFFGARFDLDTPPVPGRGYACDPAGAVEVQVACAATRWTPGPPPPSRPTESARPPWAAP
ncbi:FtsK/SpoIIIE domain-containing protein [Arthrobacter sp. TmT3-37]